MIDPDFYGGLARELNAKLRRLSAFARHSGTIGVHHEEIVREALRPLLSKRFSIKTGFVFAKDGVVSKQGDIIIVDENDPSPYFFQMGDLVVVHPRAVACVIEVKTHLTRDQFKESLKNLRTFCEVGLAVEPAVRFQRAIFAFESVELSAETLHDWFQDADVPDEVWSYPQIIFALRQGTLHLEASGADKSPGYRFIMGEESDEFKARGLSIFLHTVRKSLEVKAGLNFNPFEYADLRELKWSTQRLRIGHGLVED